MSNPAASRQYDCAIGTTHLVTAGAALEEAGTTSDRIASGQLTVTTRVGFVQAECSGGTRMEPTATGFDRIADR